jgi:hypothetical protein
MIFAEGPIPGPMEDIGIPDKCEGCAVQCDLVRRLAVLKHNKFLGEAMGRAMVGEESGFDRLIEDEVEPEDAEDMKMSARQQLSHSLDDLDSEIEETQGEIDANAATCSGILQISGVKEGIKYTVNVCTSRLQNEIDSGQPNHLPVHILAEHENGEA